MVTIAQQRRVGWRSKETRERGERGQPAGFQRRRGCLSRNSQWQQHWNHPSGLAGNGRRSNGALQ